MIHPIKLILSKFKNIENKHFDYFTELQRIN